MWYLHLIEVRTIRRGVYHRGIIAVHTYVYVIPGIIYIFIYTIYQGGICASCSAEHKDEKQRSFHKVSDGGNTAAVLLYCIIAVAPEGRTARFPFPFACVCHIFLRSISLRVTYTYVYIYISPPFNQ